MSAPERCPCGSGSPFAGCCAPLLSGERQAQSAEQLMRSRFTAFAVGDAEYLM
ncbi:YchJ family metal-binding protein, partial [Leucobacter sp. M11]|uniref:YchJ family metal-binding protein n=1 Tax=Leucobacter sp. M11 TaxID=2993565 RepID=UPI002D7E3876